jgi:hypothetical protein
MTRNQLFPSRWLKANDIAPDGEEVTIRSVTIEQVGQNRETKPVVAFEELDRALVCNRTNFSSIADLTGEPDTDNWPGHRVKLVRVHVPFGSKNVEAIRIEAAEKPAKRSKHVDSLFDI